MTVENLTNPIEFFPESLHRQQELTPVKDRWQMGPISLALRGNRNQMCVTWELQPGSPSYGEFEDGRGKRWRYELLAKPAGGMLKRTSVSSLWLRGESETPLLAYSYTLEKDGQFKFAADIPDTFGNTVHLVSGVGGLSSRKATIWIDQYQPPIVPEYSLDFWGDKFRARKQRTNKELAFIQPVLERSAVEQWLKLGHLRQTDYILRHPDVLQMFLPRTSDTFKTGIIWNEISEKVIPRDGRITQIARRLREGMPFGEEIFPIEADELLVSDLSPTTRFEFLERGSWVEEEMKTVVGLVLIIHNGKHWLTPPEKFDSIKVLLGWRGAGKPMAGKLAILSGKLEASRRERNIEGVVEAAIREIGEEITIERSGNRVKLRDRRISSSPVFIPGGYVDLSTGEAYQVVTGVVIVADSENRLTFGWSGKGKAEFIPDEPPILLRVTRLQEDQIKDQLHPGVRQALSQGLELLSVLGPEAIKIVFANYLHEIKSRRFV